MKHRSQIATWCLLHVQQALDRLFEQIGLVRVSNDDADANYLESKLTAGAGITLTTLSPGAHEQIEIACANPTERGVTQVGGTVTNPAADTYILIDGAEETGAATDSPPSQGFTVTRDGTAGRLWVYCDTAPPTTSIDVKLWRFPVGAAPGDVLLTATVAISSKVGYNLAAVSVDAGDVLVVSHNNTDADVINISASWEVPS